MPIFRLVSCTSGRQNTLHDCLRRPRVNFEEILAAEGGTVGQSFSDSVIASRVRLKHDLVRIGFLLPEPAEGLHCSCQCSPISQNSTWPTSDITSPKLYKHIISFGE